MASGLKILMSTQEISEPPQSYSYVESVTPPITQNLTNSRSQVYEINGEVRVHGNSSTIFIPTTQQLNTTTSFWNLKPYARNFEKSIMKKIKNINITYQNPNTTPPCTRLFTAPAVIFSTGGYLGNPFHDFTDVLIPLYLTSRQFNTTVIFLVVDMNPWWISKYKPILHMLSKYEIIDMASQNEVLCFPRIIAGLKSHKVLNIDKSISPNYSVTHFTKFLKTTYSLERGFVGGCKNKSRRLRNEYDVAELAQSVGFDVSVREMGGDVSSVARFGNGFDVMVAVHGAGMTNMVFLLENAIVVQIVPFGVEFNAKDCFENSSRDMNLRYLGYKVEVRESSLVEKYGVGSEVFDLQSLYKKEWAVYRSVYLDEQDVSVDLFRFNSTLLEAMELVCNS
ncbi:beta-1,2-xylosyltransferase XYXT1-like isoform X2 [Salvia hispanica]|nr:beta-1,2-xylosyltransferase XYXT1-like isoform X2 [Salvia hispanica]